MATTKITKREMFTQILDVVTEQTHKDFILHEIELLDNRAANKNGKLSERQTENEHYMTLIEGVLTTEGMTCKEIKAAVPELSGLEIQRITPMMKKLVEGGKAVRAKRKQDTIFCKPE